MIKKLLPYVVGLLLLASPVLAANIKYSALTSGGTITTSDKFPVLRTLAVTGAADNGSGLIRLTTATSTGVGIATNDILSVSSVGGTTEANGTWTITVVNSTHVDLQGSAFVHAYTSGGQLNFNPSVAVNTLATLANAPNLSISGQTGLLSFTGLTSTSRIKTVRDAADTMLELGGSYTPTGTWTNMTLVAPALGTPASGVATNLTGTAAGLTAGTASAVAASGITGTTLASNVTASSLTSFGASIALGTPASGVATNLTGTATALNIGGNAATATAATTAGTLTGALSANQLLGSLTAVAPTGQSVPSCSTAASALLWTSGTGFSCNTSITANTATTATTATNATNTAITDDTTTNATMYPTWVTTASSNQAQKVASTKLTFNPSTGVLAATTFSGAGTSLTGTAASLTAGTVTTNANLTGDATSSGNATTVVKINGVTQANVAATVTSNAGTCPITSGLCTFTNSSAATMAITLATSSAVDGQKMIVRIYDFSGVAQTIGWTNTENSTVSVPTTSAGSATLPLTVGFMYNSATSKWRCVASS